MRNPYITAKEAAKLFEISESHAYQIFRDLNNELKSEGYITLRGKVPRKRLLERMGLGEEVMSDE